MNVRKYNSMVFEDESPVHLSFHFENLKESGDYYLKKRTLNRQNGSILNEWGKFQYDMKLTRQDVKYLQGISFPTLSQSKKRVTGGDRTLDMKVVLEPHRSQSDPYLLQTMIDILEKETGRGLCNK